MADAYIDDILLEVSLGKEEVTVLYPYLRQVFINETPFITRFPRKPAAGRLYNIVSYNVRQRPLPIGSALGSGDTTLTLTDASMIMPGDNIQVWNTAGSATERMQALSINYTTNVVTVARALSGTTAVANSLGGATATLSATLIGNSRTGGEVAQVAFRDLRVQIPNGVQTYQFPVQVSGLANAVANVRLPAGISDVFSLEQKTKMTEMMRDMEYVSYFGQYDNGLDAGSITNRVLASGVIEQIGWYNGTSNPAKGSNVNVTLNAGASFTFLNFVAATIQKIVNAGGDPDVCICSTDFLSGLLTWGFAKQMITTPRETSLGLPIKEIVVPFPSGPVTFIPAYQLNPLTGNGGTAIVLTSEDVCVREIRPEFWQLRGLRGDAKEGDFIADQTPELGHPGWHAYVSGITSYA